MPFDEWWLQMKPAECDELKTEFIHCWNTAVAAAIQECSRNAPRPHPDKPDAIGARNCVEISDAIDRLLVVF